MMCWRLDCLLQIVVMVMKKFNFAIHFDFKKNVHVIRENVLYT